MKSIYIMRHAKSSWDDAMLADFDRPLNDRGLRAATFMGTLIKEKGFDPDLLISSPAVRALTTAKILADTGALRSELKVEPRIYEASPMTLREVLSEISEDHRSAMLVGHNPGIEDLIRYLTGDIEPMPTAAIAVIEMEIIGWAELDAKCGKVRKILRPRELMG